MTQFKGSITALVTPFKGGSVDERAFQELVERQITAGSHGLVPVGTTGESATLSDEEHEHRAALRLIIVMVGASGGSEVHAARVWH